MSPPGSPDEVDLSGFSLYNQVFLKVRKLFVICREINILPEWLLLKIAY